MKNKNMQNPVSFNFFFNFTTKKSATYAKFEKNSENDQKKFLDAAEFRKKLKNTNIQCVSIRVFFNLYVSDDIKLIHIICMFTYNSRFF